MHVSVLVPSSLAREAEDKRAATRKLGSVARAATIYRVDRLVVYDDRAGETGSLDGGFVETVLRYAATPPYLRTEAWGKRDELEYAGVLPPLHASSRTGSGSSGPGSPRQGIVTEVGPEGRVRVNCGLQHPISLPVPAETSVEEGERVTVRVSSRRPVRAKLVEDPPPGFAVERADVRTVLEREDAGLRVAASRHGTPLTASRLGDLAGTVQRAGLTLALGAPDRGLPPILDLEVDAIDDSGEALARAIDARADPGAAASEDPGAAAHGRRETADELLGPAAGGFDCWLNTIPNQGSETVRTEEAMFASLATCTLTE